MIHVYVGDGKGKTTAAFGLALRAMGAGWTVRAVQFLKDGRSGEAAMLRDVLGVEVLSNGPGAKFTFAMNDDELVATRRLHDDHLRRAIDGAACDAERGGAGVLVVLDELLDALDAGLVDEGLVRRALAWGACADGAHPHEVVLTGRVLPAFVRAAADYVTCMEAWKHPYERGVPARRGVEY